MKDHPRVGREGRVVSSRQSPDRSLKTATSPSLDIPSLFAERDADRYDLHARYLNEQAVRMLETVGFDVGFCEANGQYLYDRDGARYLDLLTGWGVFAIGRNHPAVRRALKSTLDANLPNLVQLDVSPLAGVLAERLLRIVPFCEKVFFANSGTETVEAAIKFARIATGRSAIVYCSNGFHGLTYGSLSLNGAQIFRQGFGPLLPDCFEIPFNDLPALDEALSTRQVAAFVVEPIQGFGAYVPDDAYLQGAHELCRKYGTLLVADEVQTGLGRTGRFLATEHWGIEPDIVLLAKPLSGGYVPIGAVLTRKWIFDKVFNRMGVVVHGSSYAKNDLAMTAALATLEVIESERLIDNAARTGVRLLAAFKAMAQKYELVKEARGKGLLIGIEFCPPRSESLEQSWNFLDRIKKGLFSQFITIKLFKEQKILSQVAGNGSLTIRIMPSMTISEDDCDWIERSFETVIAESHQTEVLLSLGKKLITQAQKARR
jgi:ornithine--oxo-acid transaminase